MPHIVHLRICQQTSSISFKNIVQKKKIACNVKDLTIITKDMGHPISKIFNFLIILKFSLRLADLQDKITELLRILRMYFFIDHVRSILRH